MKNPLWVALRASLLIFCLLASLTPAIRITGLSGGVNPVTGARPFRFEITSFSQSGPAFDLFILALSQLQSVDETDPQSYFQIAGIHGYPSIPWDGVNGGGTYPGYCAHACVVFPTWHRPYLALYEQILGNLAIQIANTYPPNLRNQYLSAAQTFRIPYWDWAQRPALPNVVIQQTLQVNTPTGAQVIQNPLYNYTFQRNAAARGFPQGHPMSAFPATVRWWNSNTGQSDQSAASAVLAANGATILSLVYQLFTTVTDYTAFSCTFPAGRNNPSNNVESIHNNIHNFVGGWGFMTFPEVSAFDPVFWMHHANVDRLFAMWQALNPNAFVVPTVNAYGSYYEPQGTIDSANSSLAPFHSDEGTTMYTSEGVRSTRVFGYTYPEIVDWGVNPAVLRSAVRRQINSLYNPPRGRRNSRRHRQIKRAAMEATCTLESFHNVSFELAKDLEVNNLGRQWSIHLILDRFAINKNFEINFFMGHPPVDTSTWSTAPNLVGTHAQFIAANVSIINSLLSRGEKARGEVSLSHMVVAAIARGTILDPSPDSIVPVLQQHLTWRVRKADGCVIDVNNLSGLQISVGSRSLTLPATSSEFPTYGNIEWHPEVTHGKPGGACAAKHKLAD